ncbi:MAG: acyl carrier protein phosphodiesterase [Bacteroidota bacterium]
MVGNFLGDFVKGAATRKLPLGVQTGIEMHRAIDHLTDQSLEVRQLNRLISSRHGRYAGVVTDIGFDYFLWRHWESFGAGDFDAFTVSCYTNLYAQRKHMPVTVQGYVNQMVKDDWLRLYTTSGGMQKVFSRVRPRLSRPELLDGVEAVLHDYEAEFNQTFLVLFPRLQTLANAYRTEASQADRLTTDPL